jgi:hypothetical protein
MTESTESYKLWLITVQPTMYMRCMCVAVARSMSKLSKLSKLMISIIEADAHVSVFRFRSDDNGAN